MSKNIKCAIPKGKCRPLSILLNKAGIPLPLDIDSSRKYIIEIGNIDFILVKPTDIPIFVEFGAGDIGIVGKNILQEEARNVIELLDLKTNNT